MARAKNSDTVKIDLLFPSEFKQLKEMVDIKENSIELKETGFHPHPEYDLPYKLYTMYLSTNKRYGSMEKFQEDSFLKENTLRHKGNSLWRYYLFQLPNVEELFGLRHELKIENLKEVLQTPIFFLILASIMFGSRDSKHKICVELYQEMYKYADTALKAYENKKTLYFNEEQLETCLYFFFGKNISDSPEEIEEKWISRHYLGGWGEDRREVEDIVLKKVKEYIDEMPEDSSIDAIEIGGGTGAPFSFPKYLRTIIAGIKENLILLPFAALEKKPLESVQNTLWSKKNVCHFEGIDIEISEAFANCFSYIYMKDRLNGVMDLFFVPMEDDDYSEAESKLEEYLERYRKLCEGVLGYVIKEKDKEFEKIVFYAFERIFSVLLIKEETDILWDLIQNIVKSVIQQDQTLNREKEEYLVCKWLMDELGTQIFYEIACSPGAHYRIRLADYIFHDYLNTEELYKEYLIYKERLKPSADIEKYNNADNQTNNPNNLDTFHGIDEAKLCDLCYLEKQEMTEIAFDSLEEQIQTKIQELNNLYNKQEVNILNRLRYSDDDPLGLEKTTIPIGDIKQYLDKSPQEINDFYMKSKNNGKDTDCALGWLQRCQKFSVQKKRLILWVILNNYNFESFSWVKVIEP